MLGLAIALSTIPAEAKDVVVFAAASLKNALDDAAAAWKRETGKGAVISYAASNALAKQIEAGAPADIFFSADLDWMDYAASRNLIEPETRVNLLGNSLVLIASKDSNVQVSVQAGSDLAAALGDGRLAMGQVEAVPAGKYGKAALEKIGVWDGVKDRIAQADNVRAALLLVSRGEAPLGIVYKTDALSDPNVRIVAAFPEGTHAPIVYPVAAVRAAPAIDDNAVSFLAFLRSDRAKSFFEKQGFTFVNKSGSNS
ncbi:molybdate transport system substrate-binding protein [Microvirga guangxiensis]|uniref:Molybdate transport system substrate-binding protein n=2 Tax=Microvirga guangxiensis TaxID=549386 RepID=A0A1G5HXF0_9HYPH|nr:molybdate transport system substrate-binding protein [Microvirga guangxiensis]